MQNPWIVKTVSKCMFIHNDMHISENILETKSGSNSIWLLTAQVQTFSPRNETLSLSQLFPGCDKNCFHLHKNGLYQTLSEFFLNVPRGDCEPRTIEVCLIVSFTGKLRKTCRKILNLEPQSKWGYQTHQHLLSHSLFMGWFETPLGWTWPLWWCRLHAWGCLWYAEWMAGNWLL